MKVVLVETPYQFWPRYLGVNSPPLPLLFVGTYLKHVGHDVKIIDAASEGYTWAQMKEAIRREEPEVVGITAITKNSYLSMTAARVVKEIDPSIIVVAGGQHFTSVPRESLHVCPEIDYLVMGEGEHTAAELLEHLSSGADREELRKVKGLAFMDGDEYVQTPMRPLIEDINELPMPDYELFPMPKYHLPFLEEPGQKGGIATTSRGCVGHCTFCSERILWRSQWRGRSAINTVDELELLHKKYGWSGIQLGDAAFTTDRARNEEFIIEMQRRNLFIRTWPQTRADHVVRDRDLWKGFRSTGVTMVLMGVEAPVQEFLDDWRKEETVQMIREAAGIIHGAGVPVLQGTMMVGGPKDTLETIAARGRFARELQVEMFCPNIFTPFPGTPVWRDAVKERKIENWDYADWDFDHAIMATSYMTAAEVEEADKKLFLSHVAQPRFLLDQMLNKDRRRAHNFFLKNLWYLLTRQFRVPEMGDHYQDLYDGIKARHHAYVSEQYLDGEPIPVSSLDKMSENAFSKVFARFRARV